jgi:hypothetical protein
MSDIEFEPGATFSREENEKVEKAIQLEMELDKQELEQSKHPPVIPPGGVLKEFPHPKVGQVTILKKKSVVPVVPQQEKKKGGKTQGEGDSKGTTGGRKEARG